MSKTLSETLPAEKLEALVDALQDSQALKSAESSVETLEVGQPIKIQNLNGLPVTVIPLGESIDLGDGALLSEGTFVCAPDELLEYALGIEAAEELESPRKGPEIWRILSAAGMGAFAVLGAGAVFGGCGLGSSQPTVDSGNHLGNVAAALTADDLKNSNIDIGEACFTEPGDSEPNVAIVNGKTVITFIRDNKLFYVKAVDLKEALNKTCTAKELPLPKSELSGPGYIDYVGRAVVNGNNIYYGAGAEGLQKGDLNEDNNGDLKVTKNTSAIVNGGSGNLSIVTENGIEYLLSDGAEDPKTGKKLVRKESLTGDSDTTTKVDATCGVPHKDPETGLWVGSYFDNFGGPVKCRIVSAPTLDGLQGALKKFAAILPGANTKNPRVGTSQILLFEAEVPDPNNPGSLKPGKIYYAIVTDPITPEPPETDASPTDSADASDADDVQEPPKEDVPVTEDVPPQEVSGVEDISEDVQPPEDLPKEDVQPPEDVPAPEDVPPQEVSGIDDVADGATDDANKSDTNTQPDADPTTKDAEEPDSKQPDTKKDAEPTPECVTEIPQRIKLKVGPCEMEICPTKIGAFEAHTMHVTAENAAANEQCTVEVFIKGITKPATLTFTNTKGGKIDVNCTVPVEVGQDPECVNGALFNDVKYDEHGHKFHTKDPKGITSTGGTATIYSWEYLGIDEKTGFERFAVANHDKPGTPPLIVNHQSGQPFIVEANGRKYFYNISNGQVVDDQGNVVHKAIVDPPVEGGKEVDVPFEPNQPPVTTPPPNDNCSAAPISRKNLLGYLALGSIPFLALWMKRRRF